MQSDQYDLGPSFVSTEVLYPIYLFDELVDYLDVEVTLTPGREPDSWEIDEVVCHPQHIPTPVTATGELLADIKSFLAFDPTAKVKVAKAGERLWPH